MDTVRQHGMDADPGALRLQRLRSFGALGLYIAQHWWLYQPLAAATVVLELGYPLALVSRRARWVIVPAVFLLQAGIRVLMGPAFYQFMICNLFWVPWDRLSRRFGNFIGRRCESVRCHPT